MFIFSWIALLIYHVQLVIAQNSSVNAYATTKPVYCGECFVDYGVGAHVWFPNVSTVYVATVVYQVTTLSPGTAPPVTRTTTKFNPVIATFSDNLYYSFLAGIFGNNASSQKPQKGAVEYTFINNLTAGQTLQQTNYLEFLTYRLNTMGRNTSATGSPLVCLPATTTPVSGAFAVSEVIYNYTTVVPFDKSYDIYSAENAGIESYFSAFQSSINYKCSYSGGGVGTVKFPVTALTDTTTEFFRVDQTVAVKSPVPQLSDPTSTTAMPIESVSSFAAVKSPVPGLSDPTSTPPAPVADNPTSSTSTSIIPIPLPAVDTAVTSGPATSSASTQTIVSPSPTTSSSLSDMPVVSDPMSTVVSTSSTPDLPVISSNSPSASILPVVTSTLTMASESRQTIISVTSTNTLPVPEMPILSNTISTGAVPSPSTSISSLPNSDSAQVTFSILPIIVSTPVTSSESRQTTVPLDSTTSSSISVIPVISSTSSIATILPSSTPISSLSTPGSSQMTVSILPIVPISPLSLTTPTSLNQTVISSFSPSTTSPTPMSSRTTSTMAGLSSTSSRTSSSSSSTSSGPARVTTSGTRLNLEITTATQYLLSMMLLVGLVAHTYM